MPTSNFAKPLKRMFSAKTPARPLVQAGNKARDAQLWIEATAHYAEFLKQNPGNVAIWVQLGNCAKEGKQFDLALEAYNSAIRLNDRNADVFLQKGHLLKLMGRPSDAIACYQQSFALERQDNPAFHELIALNALSADTASAGPAVEGQSAVAVSNIYLDVTDLIDYLKVNVSLSGIQRVVSNLIVHADDYTKTVPGVSVQVVLPDYNGSTVYALNKHNLEALIRMVVTGQTQRDRLDTVLSQVVSAKSEVLLTPGDTLVIAGAFWIYQRYDLLNALRQAGIRVTVFIHDLIQVTNPEFVESAATTVFRRSLVDVLNVSSYIMTNSKFVEQDVRTYLQTRMNFDLPVTAVTLATELDQAAVNIAKVHRDYIELASEEYVLCVGTIEVRKNHLYLIKIWERLIAEFPGSIPNLVLVGKWGWQVDELRRHLAESDHLGGRLYIYNGISDVDLKFLYQNCLFTIYPSFAEGWGLPVGESLGYGKPCVASKVTAIPEVGGAMCKYIDPFDLEDGYRVVSAVLADRPALAAWTSDIQRNFRPKTWRDFSVELFGVVSRYQKDATLDRAGNNGIIEVGEVASFGNDTLVQLDIQNRRFVAARMTRISGWHGLEGWGCWASRRRASLRLNTRLDPGTDALVYLRLQTPEGDNWADCTIKIGARTTICNGLGPASQWVTAPGKVEAGGVIDITLISGKGFNLQSPRGLYIGIVSLAVAPVNDTRARLRTIEQIVPGGLPEGIAWGGEPAGHSEPIREFVSG